MDETSSNPSESPEQPNPPRRSSPTPSAFTGPRIHRVPVSPEEMRSRCDGKDCWLQPPNGTDETSRLSSRVYLAHERVKRSQLSNEASVQERLYTLIRDGQTRLLCLEPGSPRDALSCKLLVVDHGDRGLQEESSEEVIVYDALSYCWGEPKFDFPLQCNGVDVRITANLGMALMILRASDRSLPLWVDALCINQADIQEKAHQIQRMFDIYQNAATVVAWMGPPPPYTAKGVAMLRYLQEMVDLPFWLSTSWLEHPRHGLRCARNICHAKLAIDAFQNCEWASRTWIRQEAYVKSHVRLYWGLHNCSLRSYSILDEPDAHGCLAEGIRFYLDAYPEELFDIVLTDSSLQKMHPSFQPHEAQQPLPPSPGSSVPTSTSLYFLTSPVGGGDAYKSSAASVWLELLVTGTLFDATNARDRVYRYLGMAQHIAAKRASSWGSELVEHPPLPLQVDYSRSVEQVYCDLAAYLLQHHVPRLLQLCEADREQHTTTLPTWVPDWRCKKRRLLIERFAYRLEPAEEAVVPQRSVEQGGSVLVLRGKLYGRVEDKTVIHGYPPYESCADVTEFHWRRLIRPDRFDGLGPTELRPWKTNFLNRGGGKGGTHSSQAFDDKVYKEVKISIDRPPGALRLPTSDCKGLVATAAQRGDLVVWLEGAEVEMVLSPVAGDNTFRFLGPALIDKRLRFASTAASAQLREFRLV